MGDRIMESTQDDLEQLRPAFHFTPERNWINDPNGLIFLDGEYHLSYQHNPFGNEWGHMSWGHAVSTDLMRWTELPVAIEEDEQEAVFSGSAVFDSTNSSGLGTLEAPPLVAVYTSLVAGPLQRQSLAYSTDRGRTWRKYAGNPVLDEGMQDFRDPKVFWDERRERWCMVLVRSTEFKVSIYTSDNLIDWTHRSDFGPAGATDGIWECPDLFPLAADDDPSVEHWVLLVSLNPGGPTGGSGTQYFIGEFDGDRFEAQPSPDGPRWLDVGADCYAGVTFNGLPRDERVLIAWMNAWQNAKRDIATAWNGSMTVPRRLSLTAGSSPQLVSQPVPELDVLRGACVTDGSVALLGGSTIVESVHAPVDVDLVLDPRGGVDFEVDVDGVTVAEISIDPERATIAVQRIGSGLIPLRIEAPLTELGSSLNLRLLLDHGSLELFTPRSCLTCGIEPRHGALRIVGRGRGEVVRVRAFAMAPYRFRP